MKVLVACEFSGRVRDAFIAKGHDAVSCDILPTMSPGPHYEGDVRDILGDGWDLMIAFPPCTDLSIIGARYWEAKRDDGRQEAALDFVRLLLEADIPRIALENPVGLINSAIRKPDQIINPFQFGAPWRKRTCLWLKGLPNLEPTDIVEPVGYWVDGGSSVKHKSAAFGDAGFGSQREERRKAQRSLTFLGIANAMADQWG